MAESDLRATYSPPISTPTNGQTRITLPAGTGRCVLIEDLTQKPLYVNFGASNVTANPGQGMQMDYGRAQFIVPDGATTMALHSDDGSPVVVHLGLVERPLVQTETVPVEEPDPLLSILDPDVPPSNKS